MSTISKFLCGLALASQLACEGAIVIRGRDQNVEMPKPPVKPIVVPVEPVDSGMMTPDASVEEPMVYGPAPLRYQCDQTAGPLLDEPLRRLTRAQWVRGVDALISAMAQTEAPAILTALAANKAAFPNDRYVSKINKGHDGFQRADSLLSQQHADAQYSFAQKLGAEFTSTLARRTRVFGACATDASTTNDIACVETFIRRWGPQILRRPITDADVTFYRRAMQGTEASAAALVDVVAVLFASPNAFFVIEGGASDLPNANLNAHELAVRLALQLTDAPPDDLLWQSAESGSILTEIGFQTQVDRLLALPASKNTIRDFYTGWFQLHRAPDLTTSLTFPNYAALVGAQTLTTATTAAMVEDVLGAVNASIEMSRPNASVLTDKLVYTQNPEIASLYGVPTWNGMGTPPTPSVRRAGLLTRIAFLATGDVSSHPILKGVRLRTALLCDGLGEAPPNANAEAALTPLTGMETEREKTVAMTERGGCANCHTSLINPLGFATESFDSLGRERTQERIFNTQGQVVAQRAPQTHTIPYVNLTDTRPVADAVELTARIVESKKFESCFATQYFRFSFGKTQETARDQCFLSRIETLARSGASIKEVAKAVVMAPEFKRRVWEAL
jgi:hypothetical protein